MNTDYSSRMAIDPVSGMKAGLLTSRIFFTSKKNDFYFCAEAGAVSTRAVHFLRPIFSSIMLIPKNAINPGGLGT